jgi:electron transfer flavoprotein alpha subunit
VDLKLKICRGSSVKKILVREANAYSATHVIVGSVHRHHRIRSSSSVAKYCARKLSKDCCILAVNNGKVVFQRDSLAVSTPVADVQGFGFFLSIHLCGSHDS